jgi:hypothetical protein
MRLFELDSCKIYAQLLAETKNVQPGEGFKIIRRKVISKSPPTHLVCILQWGAIEGQI